VYDAWQAEAPGQRTLTLVRPSIVYGEGHQGNMRVLIEHLRRGRFALVDGGRNRKSIGYVGNLVAFLVHALGAIPGRHVFNYADPPSPTVRELVQELLALMPSAPQRVPALPLAAVLPAAWIAQAWSALRGHPASILPQRVHALRAETTLNVDALRRAGFEPPVARRESLARTVRDDADG